MRTIGLLLILLAAASCGDDSAPDTSSLPKDLVIDVGQAGTSGVMSGFTIRADGSLWSWQGEAEPQARDVIVPKGDRAEVWKHITACKLHESDRRGEGAASRMVRVKTGGATHEATWSLPAAKGSVMELKALHRSCMQAIAAHRKDRKICADLRRSTATGAKEPPTVTSG